MILLKLFFAPSGFFVRFFGLLFGQSVEVLFVFGLEIESLLSAFGFESGDPFRFFAFRPSL